MITRRGREVARSPPVRSIRSREEGRPALERICARAKQAKLGRFGWAEWKSYRDEGHSRVLCSDSLATLAWICERLLRFSAVNRRALCSPAGR